MTDFESLTKRQNETLKIVALGHTYKESARFLGVTSKTVQEHMTAIQRKLGVANRGQATALYFLRDAYKSELDKLNAATPYL